MSPFWTAVLGSLLRSLLVALGGYMVGHHWLAPDLANEAQERILAYFASHAAIYAPIVLGLAWSVLQKYRARLHLIAAADLPAGASDAQIAEKAKDPTVKQMVTRTL